MHNDCMYAVERSDEYLAHYGIKGMRWGVRKAVKKNDLINLSKHYRKATMKLADLSLKANRDFQRNKFNKAYDRHVSGAIKSAVLSGVSAALYNSLRGAKVFSPLGSAALGAIGGALINSKGITSGRYISDRGHAKAIEKRDKFRKNIEETFKGTVYGGPAQKRHHKDITNISNQKDVLGYVVKQAGKASRNIHPGPDGKIIYANGDTSKKHRRRRK